MAKNRYYDRYYNVRSKGWVSYKNETYRNFFSTKIYKNRWAQSGGRRGGGEKIVVASGKKGGRSGLPVGKRNFINIFNKGDGGLKQLTKPNAKDNSALQLQGSTLHRHFQLLRNAVDIALWGFIQAMASHKQRVFEDSFNPNVKGFQAGFSSPRRWAPLSEVTKKNRIRLGFGASDKLVRTQRLKGAIDFKNETGMKFPGAHVFLNKKAFSDYYPEYPLPKSGKSALGGSVGVTSYKDPKGRTLVGRKGRCYGFFHNEGAGRNPQRQFIGIERRLTKQENALMDQFLFYSVFNRYLGMK